MPKQFFLSTFRDDSGRANLKTMMDAHVNLHVPSRYVSIYIYMIIYVYVCVLYVGKWEITILDS